MFHESFKTRQNTKYRQGSEIYLILRLRGGGEAPAVEEKVTPFAEDKVTELVIAAGGRIKQEIRPDMEPVDSWVPEAVTVFNVQLLNATSFTHITGLPAPKTPISPKTYANLGLPFFDLYEEPSGIHGDFKGVKRIAKIDNAKGRKQTADDALEQSDFRLITLNNLSTPIPFRPVSQVEAAVKKLNIAHF